MALDHLKRRELLFLLLYSFDMGKTMPDRNTMELIANECKVALKHVLEEKTLLDAMVPELESIDRILSQMLTEYTLERVYSTDRNILRLALYELMFKQDLSTQTIIAEARRLAKKFSLAESEGFVQQLLAKAPVRQ